MIRPEIGKLPKSIVDRIPLVMYIPPPPEISSPEASIPKPSHQYPPKPAPSAPRSRFKLIRRFGKKNGDKDTPKSEAGSKEKDVEKNEGEPMWEEYWERGEYPFVVLEGNRAACAICLMDFEEPKRIIGASETPGATPATGAETGDEGVERPSISEVPAEMATATVPEPPRAEDELHLTDAGEGAQPLRLLECGHVYHVSPRFRFFSVQFKLVFTPHGMET
ncbi:hypothetical protein DXG03_003390 [Asterophora parasitica]|uniref:Uncharacterized protein n=1 Tax=Asterophora parasitica TaxID=117018 RepID=A0A9P7K8C4_9AGAR|nr:hypothetical protein DXG03_003390 [Asterophora parasitica]